MEREREREERGVMEEGGREAVIEEDEVAMGRRLKGRRKCARDEMPGMKER